MKRKISLIIILAFTALLIAGCTTTQNTSATRNPFAPKTTTQASESAAVTETTTTTATAETTKATTSQTTTAATTVNSFGTLDDIARVCSTKATCETDTAACTVNIVEGCVNPYDVVYDYGSEYQAYVDACDWSLIFDASYYKSTFPILALQYHNDDELLLKHFQTVGIHEGRQGSAGFNVQAYAYNCSDAVYNAFGRSWAAYYIYYIMNIATERSVNTVTANNGKPVYQQMTCVYTIVQLTELEQINRYRREVNVADVQLNSELCALANYRAYLNSHDGFKKHDWAINNDPVIADCLTAMGSTNGRFAENTVTQYVPYVQAYYQAYRDSQPHYEAMVSDKYNYTGCSNLYWDQKSSVGSQFDVYAFDLHTVI
ncbi:Cysteine-rich secretory protein family protein [Ruminococcaceae bacterium YRB3002]|nr:Cysteine-rich secretory protein family protein [Ruminococcaceae bacterium YRB3002]